MENTPSLGLAITGAILGVATVLGIAFRLMGVGTSGEKYEPPTITLRLGIASIAATIMFLVSIITIGFVITKG